jgi:hypothetical protein
MREIHTQGRREEGKKEKEGKRKGKGKGKGQCMNKVFLQSIVFFEKNRWRWNV